jgi:hypothetical protein
MKTPQNGFRAYTSAPGTEEKDETYKRIVGKKHVPEIGAGSLMFRLVSATPMDFGHYMKFWLNIGMKDNGKPILLPRVSKNPFSDFIVPDGRGGTRVSKTAAAFKGCRLSQLAEQDHPVIGLSEFKDNKEKFKKSIDIAHVAHIQLIERKRDAQGKAIKNADGTPAFTVKPEEMFLEMPQSWWDQFVNIIDPVATPAAGADDDLRSTPKAVKNLPTQDLTRVIWMVTKEKRTKNPTGKAKLDIDYVLDFAGTTVLKDADMVPLKDPIDMAKAFVVINDEDLNRWMAHAEAGWPKNGTTAPAVGQDRGHDGAEEDSPESYGQRVDPGAPAGAAPTAGVSDEEAFN